MSQAQVETPQTQIETNPIIVEYKSAPTIPILFIDHESCELVYGKLYLVVEHQKNYFITKRIRSAANGYDALEVLHQFGLPFVVWVSDEESNSGWHKVIAPNTPVTMWRVQKVIDFSPLPREFKPSEDYAKDKNVIAWIVGSDRIQRAALLDIYNPPMEPYGKIILYKSIDEILKQEPFKKQGHLMIYKVDKYLGDEMPMGVVRIANHELSEPEYRITFRTDDREYIVSIVYVTPSPVTVMSPDHEAIVLDPGYYLFVHPVPRKETD